MKNILILSLLFLVVFTQSCKKQGGCTDPEAKNYNLSAQVDDGSCKYPKYGCTDRNALNYDPGSDHDNGTCQYPAGYVPGSLSSGNINNGNSSGGVGSTSLMPEQIQSALVAKYTKTNCAPCGDWGVTKFQELYDMAPKSRCMAVQTSGDHSADGLYIFNWFNTQFNSSGTPTYIIGDEKRDYYTGLYSGYVDDIAQDMPIANTAIKVTESGDKFMISGNIKFFENPGSEEYYVSVYVLENHLDGSSQLGAPAGYQHKRVVRGAMQEKPEGVLIGSNLQKGNVKPFSGEITIKSHWVKTELEFITIIWKKESDRFHVINCN